MSNQDEHRSPGYSFAFPWYLQSAAQGIATGILIAQGGFILSSYGFFFSLLDYAGLKRSRQILRNHLVEKVGDATSPSIEEKAHASTHERLLEVQIAFEREREESRRKRADLILWWRPVSSFAINGIVSGFFAAIVAPFSPYAYATQNLFHLVSKQPVTFSNRKQISKSVDFLLTPGQKYWLTNSQIKFLETNKRGALNSVNTQALKDQKLYSDAQYSITTPITKSSYEAIKEKIYLVTTSPRYEIATTKAQKERLNQVRSEVDAYALEIDRQRKAEEARKAAIARQKEEAEQARIKREKDEAIRQYASDPSICTGPYEQYYRDVCRKVFEDFPAVPGLPNRYR